MTETYEQTIGPIHPGFYKPISLELQKSLRDMEQAKACDRVWVRLSISHPSLDPDGISELLQLTPDHVSRQGDTIFHTEKYHLTADGTHWSLSSDQRVFDVSLEKHLEWMLDQLFGKLPAIRSIQQSGGGLVIRAHMDLYSPVVVPVLEIPIVQRLAQLRAPLQFIFRYVRDEHTKDIDE